MTRVDEPLVWLTQCARLRVHVVFVTFGLFSSECCQQYHIWVSDTCIHFLAYYWAVCVYVYVSCNISDFWQLQITTWSVEWNLDVCRTASVLEYKFRRHLANIPSQNTGSGRVLQNDSSLIRFQSYLMHPQCRQHHSGSLRNASKMHSSKNATKGV